MSSEGPTLHLRCVGVNIPCDWWKVGKLYPVVDDTITADPSPSGKSVNFGPHPVARALNGNLAGRFTAVWILPDGTELEALE